MVRLLLKPNVISSLYVLEECTYIGILGKSPVDCILYFNIVFMDESFQSSVDLKAPTVVFL